MNANIYAVARRIKGLSQEQLAQSVHCSKRTIGYLEHGKKINFVTISLINKILKKELSMLAK
jgi:DNA-binding XRE family transcriptional regulator